MKKLLFILPFCAAALAEEKTVTVVYKPIAETNVSTLPGSVTDETSARTGTWTNESTGKDGVVSYRPTARDDGDALYSLPNGAVNIDAAEDVIHTTNLAWSHLNVTYQMPQVLKVLAGDLIKFSYTVTVPTEQNNSAMLTVSFVDKEHAGNDFTTGGGLTGVGLTIGVGNHSYYDTAGEKLVNGEGQEFEPVTTGSVDFAGTITGNADGSCTLTFGTGDYSITKQLEKGFTLNSVIICMDGGYSDGLEKTVYAPEISKLRISYTKPLPEPATATLSLLALAGLASRRRRH